MSPKARRYILVVVAALAAGYFLYKFRNSITLEGFRWPVVWHSVRHARIWLLVLATAAIYACFAIRALRWMCFSRALGRTHFGPVYSATLMGFTCTFLLGRAGEPIRPVLIARKDSLSMPGMFGVYVLERVADMAATAVLAGCALLFFDFGALGSGAAPILNVARTAGLALFIALLALIGFLAYFRFHGGAWLAGKLTHPRWRRGWRKKIAALLEGFSEGLRGIRTWSDLAVLIGYTAIHWIVVVFVFLWTAHAFGGGLAQLTFAGALLVLAFTMVGSAVQLPGVGGGAQVAMFLVFTLIFGVEKEPAAVASIVIWLIGFASCSLAGLPLLFREGWSMGDLRRMARESERASEATFLADAEAAPESREASS